MPLRLSARRPTQPAWRSWCSGNTAVCDAAVDGFESLRSPHAPVARRIAHRFPEPEVAGSNPAGGTRSTCQTSVAQRKERQLTKLRMGVRFSPGVRTDDTSPVPCGPRSSTERAPVSYTGWCGFESRRGHCEKDRRREHGWWVRHAYNVRVAGSIPARRTMFHHGRISSTGQSTCLVNRRRGFESCIRLHERACLRSSTDRAASFYLAGCGFESRRRLDAMPPSAVITGSSRGWRSRARAGTGRRGCPGRPLHRRRRRGRNGNPANAIPATARRSRRPSCG
jgi:hypothetical protein